MLLAKILRVVSLAVLALRGAQAGMVCEKGGAQGTDFTCGDIPEPFQPCKDFSLSAGRTDRSTTLWMLGEFHNKKELTNPCIEELTALSDEHVVYIEGVAAGKEIDCARTGLKNKPGRKCIGSDDMQAHKEVNELPFLKKELAENTIQVALSKLHQKYNENKLSDKDFATYLKNVKNNYMQFNEAKLEEMKGRSVIAAIDRLLDQYKNNPQKLSFQAIFLKLKENLYKPTAVSMQNLEKYKQLNLKRNRSLTALLAKHPKGTLAVVRCGKNHVVPENADDPSAAEYVRQELAKGPHQNRYAILAMN
jgi:hypothetical protein